MAQTAALVDVLKRELRARGVTYAQVARSLKLSEASVKRMFSKRDFTLKRLDRICELTHAEFSDLARLLHEEESLVSQLSWEQEREIVSDRKLFLAAVCALNHVTCEQIVAVYDISRAECIQLLVRLDRLGFIQLQPNNRIKLLVSPTFSWLPDGPIQRFFNEQAHSEYFRSRFARPARVHGRHERHAVAHLQRGHSGAPEAHRAGVLGAAERGRRAAARPALAR